MRKRLYQILAVVAMFCTPTLSAQTPEAEVVSDSLKVDAPLIDYNTSKDYIIRNIEVYGANFVNHRMLLGTAGLTEGEVITIPGTTISNAINKIWAMRRFTDVDIQAEPIADSIDLHIYLTEHPQIYKWGFEGIRKGEMTTLKDKMKLKQNTELSDYILEKNSNFIRDHYIQKGFRNVTVDTRITNDTIYENAVNVTFVVNKGEKVKIEEIIFEDNTEFTDKRLRRAMKKIHQRSINFFQNSKLKEKEFEEDKTNLLDFYNSRGYRNATIVSDSVYVISPDRIGLVIKVDEGKQYYYRNITFVGNSKYPTEYLSQLLGIKPGDIYDKKTLYKRIGYGSEDNAQDMSTINSLYQNDGYLASQVTPTEIIIGSDSIDLEIRIFEGEQYTINKVDISGNGKVNDEVIRREVYTRPGELYNRSMVMRTITQLAAMGHFDEMALQPNMQIVQGANKVDIGWPLQEKASDQFAISGGWGAGMFIGSASVALNNFSVKNMFKKGAWRPYPHGQNQRLMLSAQSNGTYYSAVSLSFTEPWLGGKKPNSLSVSAYWSEETTNYYNTNTRDQFFRAMGVTAGLGRRLEWPDQYFTLYNEIGYQAYQMRDWDYFLFQNGWSNIITLRSILSRSSVDSSIFPTSGSSFTLSLALTPPYSLFTKKDYSKMSDQDKYRWIEYHKWGLNAEWYYPLSNDNKLIFMAKLGMGYLGSYNKYKVSPFEGFDVGGDGMSGYNVYGVDIISMRGYDDGSLTPSSGNNYARAYNKYTAELRYPLLMETNTNIFGLVFAEAGNAFTSWQNFNPFEVKRSAGVGVRLFLSAIGQLGIDWGWGFDRAYGSSEPSGSHFHFVIGQQF